MYGGFCGPHKVFTTTLNPGMLGLDNAVVYREDSPDINTLLDLEGNEIHFKTKLENIFNSSDVSLTALLDSINVAIVNHINDEESHKDTDTQYTVINDTNSTNSGEVLSAPQANPEINGTLAGNINRMIAPYFSATKNYGKGESCAYGNKVWLFFADKPAGGWDQSKCYTTSIYSQITGNHLATDWFSIPSAATVNPDNYGFCWHIHNMIAPYYSIYKTYSLGEYVTYQYKIYRCQITVGSPESFTSFKWTEVVSVTALINAIVSRLDAYDNSKLVMYRTTEGERTKMVDKNDQVLYTENLTKNIIDETTEVPLDTTLTSISNHMADTAKHAVYSVTKLATPVAGYISSYRLTADGVNVGDTINIPKDFLVKSGSVKTCTVNDAPVVGYVVGDKYIDFVVNSVNNDATNSNIYIKVSDLIVNYTDGDGISITDTSIAVKIDSASSNGLSVSTDGIALALATSTTAGAMSSMDKIRVTTNTKTIIATLETQILSTAWVGVGPYTADVTLTVSGETINVSTHDINVSPIWSSNVETARLEMKGYSNISKGDISSNNTLTITCFDLKPTVDLNLMLEVIKLW